MTFIHKALFTLLLISCSALYAAPVMVTGNWLEQHYNDANIVIIDMSTDQTQYRRFHLPGAQYLPYRLLNKKNRTGVSLSIDPARTRLIMGALGISNDSHVIVYDDMGGLDAGRLFWLLERIGHKDVSVLDGGLVQWILDGRKVTNVTETRARTHYAENTIKGRDNNATLSDVMSAIDNHAVQLLDVRSKQEFEGTQKQTRSGHIPSAQLWTWQDSVDFAKGFKLKPKESLLTSLKKLNSHPTTETIVYCRSAHRASQSYLALRSLGYTNVKVYDGSMSEWSRIKDAPIKKGLAP